MMMDGVLAYVSTFHDSGDDQTNIIVAVEDCLYHEQREWPTEIRFHRHRPAVIFFRKFLSKWQHVSYHLLTWHEDL